MKKLRLAVIGTGSVVREIYQHLYFHSEYSDFISVQAVADTNAKCLNEFCDKYKIPQDRRFTDFRAMLEKTDGLDAVQVNTPDNFHCAPTVAALERGLDVLVPKPTASTLKDAHMMISAAAKSGRLLGIDFHKREDPRIKECAARYQSGKYGKFQCAVWYMLDKLLVADPNHSPRFFASANFAEVNSPVSFLTVHMADAFMNIVRKIPTKVRARGFSQKLPGLKPLPVKGYDLVDTEIEFEGGSVAHIITGWHIPNSAHSLTVQSSRMICSDGLIDLGIDSPGYYEVTHDGITQVNPLFRNFEKDGMVSGYGMRSPGIILRRFLQKSNGVLPAAVEKDMMTPFELGFYTTLVLQGAEKSLADGARNSGGITVGKEVDLKALLEQELGAEKTKYIS